MESKFPEAWANLEMGFNILKVVTGILLLICLMLSISLMVVLKRPPILVKYNEDIPSVGNVTYLKIDNEWISAFVSLFLKGYADWDGENYDLVVKRLENVMTEQMKIDLMEEFEKGKDIVKENEVSNQFTLTKIEVQNNKPPYLVLVYGKNKIMSSVGGEELDKIYKIIIRKQSPVPLNPWGLVVSGFGEIKGK